MTVSRARGAIPRDGRGNAVPQSECPPTAPSRLHGEPSKPAPHPPPRQEGLTRKAAGNCVPSVPVGLRRSRAPHTRWQQARPRKESRVRAGCEQGQLRSKSLPPHVPGGFESHQQTGVTDGSALWARLAGTQKWGQRQEPAGVLQQVSRGTATTGQMPSGGQTHRPPRTTGRPGSPGTTNTCEWGHKLPKPASLGAGVLPLGAA